MTIETTDLSRGSGPTYRRLADRLAEAVAEGRLGPGERLPPQRDLAYRLKVTVGTVGRAYDILIRRGLARGEVGRGTFVVAPTAPSHAAPVLAASGAATDLTMNEPAPTPAQEGLASGLAAMAADAQLLSELARYPSPRGHPRHKPALARWLRDRGPAAEPQQLILTSGAEGGLVVALLGLCRAGDAVLVESLTYPKIKLLAQRLGLRPEPVTLDAEGVVPDSILAAARHSGARTIVLGPNLHNPTTTVMPMARREAVAAALRAVDLTAVEDDVYGPLLPDAPPPLAALAPERTVYLASVSKFLAPGLRLGLLVAPPPLAESLTGLHHLLSLGQSPLIADLFCRALAEGVVAEAVAQQRAEMRWRQELAATLLVGGELAQVPTGLHAWLRLPEGWSSSSFALTLAQQGVLVAPAETFLVGRGAIPRAVRLSLSAPRTRDELRKALEKIASALRQPESAGGYVL